jgi:hypothetical protein
MFVPLPAGRFRFQFCEPHTYSSEASEMLACSRIIQQKCAELNLSVGRALTLSSKIPLLSVAAAWHVVNSTVAKTSCGCRRHTCLMPAFMHFGHLELSEEKIRSL